MKHLEHKARPLKFYSLLFLFIRLSLTVLSQPYNPAMDKLAGQLHSLAKNSPAELIYLQTDKAIYETGEDLWFKAYLLDTHNFAPSLLSQTLYLQVINEKTEVPVWQEKYEARNGFADGHVFLQDSLSEGDYLVAAYTAGSYLNDKTELKSLRKIKVKKDMKPRTSVTADFNKVFYNAGDTILVKLTALSEKKEPLNSQIKAELRQGNQSLGQTQVSTNMQGTANLSFVLQSKGEGLQLNINEKYADLFDAREKSMSFPVPCKKGSTIQFDAFPEGGDLVSGLPSNLAFKAVNIEGNPLDIEGKLFEDDKLILELKSFHDGMGRLAFTPFAGKKYYIRLSVPVTDSTFLLPEVRQEGITLHLSGRDKEYLEFIISQSQGLKQGTVYLMGQQRGAVCCMASGVLNKELKIKMPLKEFIGQGIAEFTLFNEKLTPVAERLVYVNADKKIYIETKLSKDNYETREKVSLTITAKDETGQPVMANLGISVYDKLYRDIQDPKNILTHCYLTSQLKGKVYDPAYYFDSKHENREEALNLLLLTQGWRRYVWGEKNLREYGEARPPLIFDGTEGEVHATKRLKKASLAQIVKAFNPVKNNKADLLMSSQTGKFVVAPQHLKTWQGEYIYLKPMSPDEFEPRINLSDPFKIINETGKIKGINYPVPGAPNIIKENDADMMMNIDGHNTIKLPEFTIKGHGTETFRDKYIGHLDSLAKLDLCTDYECSEGCSELNCQFHTTDKSHKPVEGKEYCKRIGVNLAEGYYMGDECGIIYHYAKLTQEELLRRNNLSRVKAYYAHREFYQPKYDKETENDTYPDFRNTLLWKPSVATDEKGEAALEFFCSDINTRFVGKIEGVSGEGLLGTKDFEFAVRKRKPLNQGN